MTERRPVSRLNPWSVSCRKRALHFMKGAVKMLIKESEVLERIGMCIDQMDADELATLHNMLYETPISGDDIELQEGWHLIPKEGAH